jgi:flagellar assembly factor FliW
LQKYRAAPHRIVPYRAISAPRRVRGGIRMKIRTATLGVVEASPESFLTLPEGLIGFEEHREFALLALSDYEPFRWLQSFSDPGLAFPLLNPHTVTEAYEVSLTDGDRQALGLEAGEQPVLYAIASVSDSGAEVTVNLRAPLAINPRQRTARQVVLNDSRWEIQHPVYRRAHTQASERRLSRGAA